MITPPDPSPPFIPLERLRIASPCNASWDEMKGDDAVRFCRSCEKNVYNLSAMTRPVAEALLAIGERPCLRFYRRADGTVMTADCPVGLRAAARRKLAVMVGSLLAGITMLMTLLGVAARTDAEVARGLWRIHPFAALYDWLRPVSSRVYMGAPPPPPVMGEIAVPTPEVPPNQPPHVLMGK